METRSRYTKLIGVGYSCFKWMKQMDEMMDESSIKGHPFKAKSFKSFIYKDIGFLNYLNGCKWMINVHPYISPLTIRL